MKALIIDDENKARRLLERLLQEQCQEITEIFQAADLTSGVEMINVQNPDIVYLDIEMPEYSGLQILEFFEDKPIDFQLIFTTAYNQYAVDAFKLSATDYLLKPIDAAELKTATQKAIKALKEHSINHQLIDLKKAFNQLALNKIALDVPKGIIFIAHEEIIFFEADGMYTRVYLDNNKSELICKPLKHFVQQLNNLPIFYKPHRSYLVNLKNVKELSKKDGHHLVMSNNKTVPISKDKREEFMSVLVEVFNT